MALDSISRSSAERLAGLGFTLVPMQRGRDAPALASWDRQENLVTTPAQARSRFGLREYNLGVDLRRSGLALLDVTAPGLAASVFDLLGLDLSRLLEHKAVADGSRPDQRRALFRLRPGQTFIARPLSIPVELAGMLGADAQNGPTVTIGQLCGGPLDLPAVVPPSVDQSRGCRYRWTNDPAGPSRLEDFPFLLEQLAALSVEWDLRVEAAMRARMTPPAKHRTRAPRAAARGERGSVWVTRVVSALAKSRIAGREALTVDEVMAAVKAESGRSKSWRSRATGALNDLIAVGLVHIVETAGQQLIELTEETKT
jgi:hypothetical protein